MRPVALVELADEYQEQERLSPPPATTCTWQPYANSRELGANAAVIVIVLLCALICALALNAAIRCSIRRSSRSLPDRTDIQRKPSPVVRVELPTVVFSAEMKLAECAICLLEFVEGDGIRVLRPCRHGFHVHCIHQWLSSHSSCPICRVTCLPNILPSSSGHRPDTGTDTTVVNGDNLPPVPHIMGP